MSTNDITGDKIQTKGVLSEQGRDNWDTIFGKKHTVVDTSSNDPHYVDFVENADNSITITGFGKVLENE